ncbi:MAG: hypothetical protein AUG44_13875 [Actinobacteria bacterium 13_1_20CM_3_71_11]|nr:MAG: hypothetical protein AUG44_13875 [Actinobacteria bacterium 13_1_20CM_3_71_11]
MSHRVRRLASVAALSIAVAGVSALAASPANAGTSAPLQPAPASTSVLISQVSTQGPAGIMDEFIELQNVQSTPLNISGYSIWACSATGQQTILATVPVGTVLQGTESQPGAENGRFYLLANANSVGFTRFNPCTETAPAPAQTGFADQSVIRFAGVDTNVNAFDFTLIAPSFPRNSTFTSPFPSTFHSTRVG